MVFFVGRVPGASTMHSLLSIPAGPNRARPSQGEQGPRSQSCRETLRGVLDVSRLSPPGQ